MASELKILVVEDEADLRAMLSRSFEREGHEVVAVPDGDQALEHAESDGFDVVLLDVALGPGPSGYDVARELRARRNVVPIIMLTALDSEADAVQGLEAGADDYVTKPFGLAELRSRIRAVLRRVDTGRQRPSTITVGGLAVDLAGRRAHLDGAEVDVTPREFDLLAHLAARVGTVVSKRELLTEVWQLPYGGSDKTVDVHLSWLRRKLGESGAEPRLLQTVRGVGVRLAEPEPGDEP